MFIYLFFIIFFIICLVWSHQLLWGFSLYILPYNLHHFSLPFSLSLSLTLQRRVSQHDNFAFLLLLSPPSYPFIFTSSKSWRGCSRGQQVHLPPSDPCYPLTFSSSILHYMLIFLRPKPKWDHFFHFHQLHFKHVPKYCSTLSVSASLNRQFVP